MPEIILIIFLAVGWTLTGVLYVFRTRGLREANEFLSEAQSESAYKAIEAERRAATAETECQYMKLTLANVLQRPAVAVMTDDNIQQLAALIESMIKPNSLN